MNPQEVTTRIETVFARVFGKRTPFFIEMSRLDEPQWTSLKHVEFIVGLEREFGIRFDGSDATDMTSIPIVLDRVSSRLP